MRRGGLTAQTLEERVKVMPNDGFGGGDGHRGDWRSPLEVIPSGQVERRRTSRSPFRTKISLSQDDTDTMSPLLSRAPTITFNIQTGDHLTFTAEEEPTVV